MRIYLHKGRLCESRAAAGRIFRPAAALNLLCCKSFGCSGFLLLLCLKYQSYVLLAELSSLVMRSIILKRQIRGKRKYRRGRKKKQIRGRPRICLYFQVCFFTEFNTL